MKRLRKKLSARTVMGGLASAILICGIFIWVAYLETNKSFEQISIAPPKVEKINYFEGINLEAKAVAVYDVRRQRLLFGKDATSTFPLASVTKVMTALVASGEIPKDQIITIDRGSLAVEGESGLVENQQWKFKDLLDYTLLVSSNDGAHAIAKTVSIEDGIDFTKKMNDKARNLGLFSMKFNNESGLDVRGTTLSGGYGSAKDVARLFGYILEHDPALLEVTKQDSGSFKSLDGTAYYGNNTDLVASKIPQLLASKTGYTALAGGNLAVAFDAGFNHPIVIVVLGSSWDGRFSDVLTLASSTLKATKINSIIR